MNNRREVGLAQNALDIAIGIYDLHKSFKMGREKVLDGISLEIPKGKITFLLGPSGSGKSMILKHIVGLMRPDSGEIRIFDSPLSYQTGPLNEIRKQFGVLFQEAALFDFMDVFRNIAFPLVAHRRHLPSDTLQGLVFEKLRAVGLHPEAMKDKFPNQLSGGMKKRVGLARALILKPKIMLYDEPTTGLDPVTRATVEDLIVRSNQKFKITSLVITHDVSAALRMADLIAFISGGKLVFYGSPQEFPNSSHPVVSEFLRAEERHRQGRWTA